MPSFVLLSGLVDQASLVVEKLYSNVYTKTRGRWPWILTVPPTYANSVTLWGLGLPECSSELRAHSPESITGVCWASGGSAAAHFFF